MTEFVEYREHPSGLEVCGVETKPLGIKKASAIVIGFRTDRRHDWLRASAGSAYLLTRETWESWPLVENPFGV